jgi:hypothetical protein
VNIRSMSNRGKVATLLAFIILMTFLMVGLDFLIAHFVRGSSFIITGPLNVAFAFLVMKPAVMKFRDYLVS